MSLQDFIQKYMGVKNVGNTDANKGECVGLVMVYIDEVLNLSHIWGHARDLFNNAPESEWEKVENSPNVYPSAGDIMCWGASWGGGFGHTGVVESSSPSTDSFICFEQNYPTGSSPHLVTRKSWNGIIGWLHPKNSTQEPNLPLKDMVIDWYDEEGNRHEVGWYVREWFIEKKKVQNVLEDIENKNDLIEQYKEQVSNFKSKALSDAEAYKDMEKERTQWKVSYSVLEDQFKTERGEWETEKLNLNNKLADSEVKRKRAEQKIQELTFWEFILVKLGR